VRNRGTIGGSLANADPAADYPASLLALDGIVETHGPDGARSIAAGDWSVALMETALKEGEILARIRFPLLAASEGAAYVKVPHPASRFATVGIAAKLRLDGQGVCVAARIACTGVGEMAQRVPGAEALLIGVRVDAPAIAAAAERLAADVGVVEDGLLGAG
jgi:carbon-monoxide dehydrogenase medium subunit